MFIGAIFVFWSIDLKRNLSFIQTLAFLTVVSISTVEILLLVPLISTTMHATLHKAELVNIFSSTLLSENL